MVQIWGLQRERDKERGRKMRARGTDSLPFIDKLVHTSYVTGPVVPYCLCMRSQSFWALQEVNRGEGSWCRCTEHESQSRKRKLAENSAAPPPWDPFFQSHLSCPKSQYVRDKSCLCLVLHKAMTLYLSDDERLHVREKFNSNDAIFLLFRPNLIEEKNYISSNIFH